MGNNANIFALTQAAGADGVGLSWFAATGSTAPTDATTALAAAWKNAGMCSENGITVKFNESSKNVKAAGSVQIQRKLVTDSQSVFDLEFLEVNQYSWAVYNRLGITSITPGVGTGAFTTTSGLYVQQYYAFTFDMIDGGKHIRGYCPQVEVTNRTDLKFPNSDNATLGIELTAYPNSSGVAIQWFNVFPALG
jgi:hypothetical protein